MKYSVLGEGVVEINSGKKGPRIGFVCNVHAALLQKEPALKAAIKFTQYAQSSKVMSSHDSSVSYASA
ncbi:MAG: hypothetical protein AAF412_05405, partial [Pseudomonadota bacterium]